MAKHSKLYDKSPKLERNEDGEVAVNKGGDDSSPAEAEDDPHQDERNAMYKRHEEEQVSMHDRHKKDMKEMHKRHTESKEKPDSNETEKE